MTNQLSFFDTIDLGSKEFEKANNNALRQEFKIYGILEDIGTHLTPFEIQAVYNKKYIKTPITSIRRALTRGTKAGIFEKVNITKKGIYQFDNHQWKIIPNINLKEIKIK